MSETLNILWRGLWCFCVLVGGVLFLFSLMVLMWCLKDLLLARPPHVDWEALFLLPICFLLSGQAIYQGWKALRRPQSISHHSH